MNKYWTYNIWTNYGIENKQSFGSSSDMNIFEFLFFYEFSSWVILDITSQILKANVFQLHSVSGELVRKNSLIIFFEALKAFCGPIG